MSPEEMDAMIEGMEEGIGEELAKPFPNEEEQASAAMRADRSRRLLEVQRTLAQLKIARALEKIASCVKDGVLQMRDVDRAEVYGKHLGEKLRGGS
jgi:PleD family two-component response regulator